GDDVAYEWIGSAWEPETPEVQAQTLFFTDRSIYRPGQTVFWKVLVYDQAAGSEPVLAAGRTVEIRLVDPHGETVASGSFTSNEFGTAAGSFVLPAGRSLGYWTLQSSLSGQRGFSVEEYKRPTFEVALDDPAEALRLGRPATFSGKARYYFGLPVTEGRVSWRVVREPVWNVRWRLWGWTPPWAGEREVASGVTTLDDEGAFQLSFTPAGEEGAAGATWSFRIAAEVTAEAGETRDTKRWFRLGEAAFEAWIGLPDEAHFLLADKPATVRIARTSLDGAPRPGEGTWTLVALRQPDETLLPADQPLPPPMQVHRDAEGYRTPGDSLRPREEPDYRPAGLLTLWD